LVTFCKMNIANRDDLLGFCRKSIINNIKVERFALTVPTGTIILIHN
jgi:hypothetical protein